MNNASASAWSGPEHYDPMGAAADHDFGSLIDFDNLDLDFTIDYSNGGPDQESARQIPDLTDSLDVQHLHFNPQVSQERRDGPARVPPQQASLGRHSMQQPAGNNYFDFSMPQYSQAGAPSFSQAQEQIYRPHAGVPPTPNSIEMHGDPGRYLQQMDRTQQMFDQRFQMRKDDATFTPLVSPAVTPHEALFRMPDYNTIPAAYFSPLTSPALNAQNHQQAKAHSQYTTSGSSNGTSPVDVDMEMLGEAAAPQQEPNRTLRSNRRSNQRLANAGGRVRQSPIVKPGRRKATVSSLIPAKGVSELVEEARASRPTSSGLGVPRSRESSDADSISPEPLLEMGPPPIPGSVTHSPAMLAQMKNGSGKGTAPATPASLMRIHSSPLFDGAPEMPPLDDLTLPEPSLTRADAEDEDTPRLAARKTPKLNPLSTPSAGAALSGKPSPMLSAISSPTSPAFAMGAGKRGDAKLFRNSKKRNSVSSSLVSPALRPKISPSIKPLLPEGAVTTSDTHALLLATKSNYQNIIDGTTVPGVVYPTSLSTNLTSKRTSHKIAEQGRRNRINTALLEMQALLPSPNISAKEPKEAKSPDSGSGAQSNNSKAAKVESAIDYIKELQQQCSDKDRLIDQKDQEVEALRRELAALKQGVYSNGTGADTSMETVSGSDSNSSPTAVNAT
ncbi:hypothetical protein BDV95DRAFT_631253 [Massariosphaeria phaeospora]|uniref:BHLH domain-containing protein n=1 Tax=Massariosphaeria phaeospora TaxID=100035 RepID=A0A7C8M949_9PLEO|nr:hypothetical protein BDV95DRAFT_631253 [Massariosphaeria phaeospora]